MKQHTHFIANLMFRFPYVIGFYSVVEAIRRASDAFLSSPTALFSRALLANPRAMGAACPRSVKLARTIANLVIPPDNSSSVAAFGMEVQKMLGPKGLLIQYTYRLNNRPSPLAAHLERVSTQTVWCNMLPAKIEVFRARAPLTEISYNKTL